MKPAIPFASSACRDCIFFRNDAAYLERVFAGLTALSSAAGSARGDDGLCLKHDRYLGSRASCSAFTPRPRELTAQSHE